MRKIYLDYNATTPVAPAVQEAMLPFLAQHYGNPSSSHSLGRAAHEAVEDARARVATMLGADPDEIVFTSGGTESNNLALKGLFLNGSLPITGHLIISSLEHPAIVAPARFLQRLGCDVTVIPSTDQGVVVPELIARAMRDDTRLVSIIHANNEIGTVQPLREIAEICHAQDCLLHTDAAQSIGKIRTQVDELDVDLLSLAGHKLYAPKGVGALYVRRGVALEPVLHGAAHEGGLRAGTENVAYLVALGKAAQLITMGLDDLRERMAMLRDRLASRLQSAISEPFSVNGSQSPRLPNTLSVNFPGVVGATLLQRSSELCASTGAACHSDSVAMSATLSAIGLAPEIARGTVRLSVGWYTSEEDIDRAADLLIDAWEQERDEPR